MYKYFKTQQSQQDIKRQILRSAMAEWGIKTFKEEKQKGREEMKKYKQSTTLASFKQLIITYQCEMKERNMYFLDLIVDQGHNPSILCNTIKLMTGPCLASLLIPPQRTANYFSIISSPKLRRFDSISNAICDYDLQRA